MVTLVTSLRFWSPLNPIRWPETMSFGIHTSCTLCIAHTVRAFKLKTCPDNAQVLQCVQRHWSGSVNYELNWLGSIQICYLIHSLCGQMIKVTQVTSVSLGDTSFLHIMLYVCGRFTVLALSFYSKGAIINGLASSALMKFLYYVAYFLYAFESSPWSVTLSPLFILHHSIVWM